MSLGRALASVGGENPVEVVVLTSGLFRVFGNEALVPEKAAVLGPLKVLPFEQPRVRCRLVEVAPGEAEGTSLAAALVREVGRRPGKGWWEEVVALRGGRRWVRSFEALPLPGPGSPSEGSGSPLRPEGVYLITGGLGGLGSAVAEHLAEACRARLVLIHRSPLPPEEDWPRILREEPGSERARRIRFLERVREKARDVLLLEVDVADPDQVRAALEKVRERFGALHGVLHAAGVPGTGLLQFGTREQAAAVLAPKVAGTLNLARALEAPPPGEKPDFLVLFSSVVAVAGSIGEADYAGANAFLDSAAEHLTGRVARRVLAIDWGPWEWDAWGQGSDRAGDRVGAWFRQLRKRHGFATGEGLDALDRLLACGQSQVVACRRGFPAILEDLSRLSRELLERPPEDRPRHRRPNLMTPYAPPSSPLERDVARVWGAVLGLEEIGLDDNFMDLGGHSLAALQLAGELRRALDLDFDAVQIFAHPTVRSMSDFFAGHQGGKEEAVPDRGHQRRSRMAARRRRAVHREADPPPGDGAPPE
jgi:NAD(P)-dependent dehydrogenase (short-subunit alcohol dehydrogenase family)